MKLHISVEVYQGGHMTESSIVVGKKQQSMDIQSKFTEAQIQLIKDTICKGATDDELSLFIQVCNRTQLDPFSRQIYALRTGGKLSFQVSIDGFRLVAQRSGEYEGQTAPQWCGSDGKWVDVWLADGPPQAAKVGVYRKGFREPVWSVARLASYRQESSPTWKKMPDLMLAKVCEALSLRRAFPAELSGLYTEDEMDQARTAPPLVVNNHHQAPHQPKKSHKKPVKEPVLIEAQNADEQDSSFSWMIRLNDAKTREELANVALDIQNSPLPDAAKKMLRPVYLDAMRRMPSEIIDAPIDEELEEAVNG